MATPRREEKKARERAARKARERALRRQRQQKVIAVFIVIALIVGLIASLATFTSDDSPTITSTTLATPPTPPAVPPGEKVTGETPCPAADGSSPRTTQFEKAPPMCIDPAKKYTATFETSEGNFVVALDTAAAPQSTNTFITLARYHYYDGTSIFRTDTSLEIIQGGGLTAGGANDPGPGFEIPDEGAFTTSPEGILTGPYTYQEGDVAFARQDRPNSSGAQFFVGAGPAISSLNARGTYLKLGNTIEGQGVLRNILALNIDTGYLGGAPSRVVTINKVTIAES